MYCISSIEIAQCGLYLCYLLKSNTPIVNLSQPCDVGQKIDPQVTTYNLDHLLQLQIWDLIYLP